MTVIAAVATDDGVFMAADSQLTRRDSIVGEVDKILTKTCGHHTVLIAVSGHHGLSSLAQHALGLPDAPDLDDTASCDRWAQAVAQALAELATEAKPPLLDDGSVDGEALLALDRRLWLLNGLSAVRITAPFAIGSGAPEARGAMLALARALPDIDPASQLAFAVRAAIDLDPNCGEPIKIQRTFSIKHDQDQ